MMSQGWHWIVILVTLANIGACWWLIRWSAAQGDDSKANDETLDHVWDGDLSERNQPLPRWWLMLFYITIVFAIGYLLLFPGFGNFDGALGWSQEQQWQTEVQQVEDVYAQRFARLAGRDYADIMTDPEAQLVGSRLFAANCTTCHGSDGGGAPGFPNLRDNEWQWGSDFASIEQTIRAGRSAVMPPWGPALGGDEGVAQMVQYVRRLSGQPHDETQAAAGQAKWALCLACHGPTGKGNPALGAPDLTNDIWLYGGSEAQLTHSIAVGRNGQMPAHEKLLTDDEIRLLVAYVATLAPGAR